MLRKRLMVLLLMAAMVLTVMPVYVSANERQELVTIRSGEIFEFRNTSEVNQPIILMGDDAALINRITYFGPERRGRALGFNTQTRCSRYINRESGVGHLGGVFPGAKIVIELVEGSHLTVYGNPNAFDVRRLLTPVFYSQILGVGGVVVFNGISPSAIGDIRFNVAPFARTHGMSRNVGYSIIEYKDGTITERSIARSTLGFQLVGYGSYNYVTRLTITKPMLLEGAFEISVDYTAFGSTPYRITSCGQRSFPPGLEQDLTPLERVPAEYYELYQMLQAGNFRRLFGEYTAFTEVFIDSISPADALRLGLTSDVRNAIIRGGLTGGLDGAVEAVMNNPDRVQAIVRDLINEMAGTNTHKADKELGLLLNYFANALGALESNAGYFFAALKAFDGGLEVIHRTLQDYYDNIAMLQSIRRLSNEPLFVQTINAVIAEYQSSLARSFASFTLDQLVGKSVDSMVNFVTGGKTVVLLTSALDFALGTNPTVSGLETIIVTNDFNIHAINAFIAAAERITTGYFNSSHVEAYRNAFNLARGIQITRYEAKGTQFRPASHEGLYIRDQLSSLRQMAHDSFIYSVPFSR